MMENMTGNMNYGKYDGMTTARQHGKRCSRRNIKVTLTSELSFKVCAGKVISAYDNNLAILRSYFIT